MIEVDYTVMTQACLGDQSYNGDLAFVIDRETDVFMCLLDVLGHGEEARELALISEAYINENNDHDLYEIINGLHRNIFGSRGLVIGLCRFDKKSHNLTYSGIGNITIRIIGSDNSKYVLKDGVVGYGRINPINQRGDLNPGDVLMMYSDGIRNSFNSFELMDVARRETKIIANETMKRFGDKMDDTTCLIFKYNR